MKTASSGDRRDGNGAASVAVHRREILRFGAVAIASGFVPACSGNGSGDGGGGIGDSGDNATDASDGVAPEAGMEAGDGADDSLDDDFIAASQPVYDTRGKRDTTNSTDTVFSASTYAGYEFQIAWMSDGAMLAWKTIVLRVRGRPPAGFEGGVPPVGGE